MTASKSTTEAPPAGITPAQVAKLLEPINPRRVKQKQGQSHLEAYDIRAHLNRVFGFGNWSADVIAMDLMFDEPAKIGRDQKPGFRVCYKACIRLTLHATGATFTEWAVGAQSMGEASHGDCHDFAVKTAESQALKRAATNLGDQFGLSLYNGGSTAAIVGLTMVGAPGNANAELDAHITTLADEADAEQPAPSSEEQSRAIDNGTRQTNVTPQPAADGLAEDVHTADNLRASALALQVAGAQKGAFRKLMRVAAVAGLADEQVADKDGTGMTLNALLSNLMREASA